MRERGEIAEKMAKVRALAVDVDGVLTDGRVWFGPEGEPIKAFHEHDAVAVRLAHAVEWPVVIITGRRCDQVANWASRYGIAEVHQEVLVKRDQLTEVAQRLGLATEQFVYLGDDLLDLPAMDLCGLTVAPRDASCLVRQKVDLVLDTPGGRGALRELVDRLLEAQQRTTEAVQGYLRARGCEELGGELLPQSTTGTLTTKIGFRG